MKTETHLKIELERLLGPDRIWLVAVEEIGKARIDVHSHKIQETVLQADTHIGRPLQARGLAVLLIRDRRKVRHLIGDLYRTLHHAACVCIEKQTVP